MSLRKCRQPAVDGERQAPAAEDCNASAARSRSNLGRKKKRARDEHPSKARESKQVAQSCAGQFTEMA
jgi:hypothetical protein